MWEMVSAADVLEQKRPIIFKTPFSSALIAIKDLHLSVSKNMMNSIEKLPKKPEEVKRMIHFMTWNQGFLISFRWTFFFSGENLNLY